MDIVNKKIREIRKNKKITLKEMSKLTGLSVSFISQVERGESSLTVTSLKKIADALAISMQELFEVDDNDMYIRNKDNQILWNLENSFTSHIRLSGKFENRKLEAIILKLEPNSVDMTPFSHEGEEFYYVLKGKALFIIEDKEFLVNQGETIHYPSTVSHTVKNPFDEELEVLSVVTPTIF
jgi:transcriptional regulator with XRE-family HTH domain